MQQKIVLFGGPSTGKTTVLNALKKEGFFCFDEVSRAVTAKAQQDGIEQLFLKDPLLFSKMLLNGREQQFLEAKKRKENIIFFDRGIPEVLGYLYYAKTKPPKVFVEKSKTYRYNKVLHFPIWDTIYKTDNERYESLTEAKTIDRFLTETYLKFGYQIYSIPFGSVSDRIAYILNLIKQ